MKPTALPRWLPLIVLLGLLILFFGFGLNNYLSFASLKAHREELLFWTQHHYGLASFLFIGIYVLAVAASIPGALFLTLAGGFLFGILWGLTLVVFSATAGATAVFFAVRLALSESLTKRANGWVERMRQGFQHNAFSYLLTLRLIPLFPFFVVNIVPALLNVDAKKFILATFFGIIPGSLVYVMLGNSLSDVFDANQTPNLGIIFEPNVLIPLFALALLSFIPILYQSLSRKKKSDNLNIIHCDLAIIGAGAGGLSLAAGASQLGLKVVLIESGKMGGDCLNYGCVPSKSLLSIAKSFYHLQHTDNGITVKAYTVNFAQVMRSIQDVITRIEKNDSVERFERFGVEIIQKSAYFIDSKTLKAGNKLLLAKRFAIATGSVASIPPVPGLDKIAYFTNETIFELQEQPSHLIVIGGGPIGCELAQAFAMLGSKVTILEAARILPKDDADCVDIVRNQLKAMHLEIYEHVNIQHVELDTDKNITIVFDYQAEIRRITGSHLLIAAGRKANVGGLGLEKAEVEYSEKGIKVNARLQTSNKIIYALGDVIGPYLFTHMAGYQAGIALRNIVFKFPAKVNYTAVPWVTFTEPELAHVGMLDVDAQTCSDIIITEWYFNDNDRAQTDHLLNGKIKVITTKKGKILGVSIVGAHAGELITPWVMAIREGKSLRSFTDVILPYPILSEISKQVASEFYKPILFSDKTRKVVHWLQKLP